MEIEKKNLTKRNIENRGRARKTEKERDRDRDKERERERMKGRQSMGGK